MWGGCFLKKVLVVVENHSGRFVAYPVGVDRIVFGEGCTYKEALANVRSAINFYIETFSPEVLGVESIGLEVLDVELLK